jgi:hypothetical protein
MATPTSSSNRSKRKGTKPITQGQNPQRGNRQKVSNAQVTNSGTRGSNAGSAKVTTGRGASAPKPADPWKAPTTKNSRTSAPKSNTTFRTQNTPLTLPNSRAQGKNLPRAGAQQLRSTTQGPRPSGKPPVKPSGNFKAPSIPKPTAATPKPSAKPSVRGAGGLLGKALVPLAMAGEVSAMMDRDRRWNDYKERNYGNTRVKPKQGNAQSRFAGARDRNLQRINSDPRFAAPKETPKPPAPRQQPPAASAPAARPSASRPSQTRPSRTTATATGSQQARPAEKKPSMGREAFDRSGKGSLGPNYGIDQFGDKNGIDMERRRAFLDAKDSQEGRKAINKLMEERRKKQRENDSTSK